MVTQYVVARNDTEDLHRISEWLLIAGIEECGITGVKADCDCPDFRVGRDATSFDREISHFSITI